jgi:hypothetical protein
MWPRTFRRVKDYLTMTPWPVSSVILWARNMLTSAMPPRGTHVSGCRTRNHKVYSALHARVPFAHRNFSNAVLWALYALADQPDLQSKLREELFSHKGVDIDSENPTMDQLNSLPYLDSVVRETLRLHSPVASTIRQAKNDSSIPLGTPIVDKNGKVLHSIRCFQAAL